MTQQPGGKGGGFKGFLTDFVITVLLITGAGFGGYFYGLHQQLAPVEKVPPGTPGAVLPGNLPPPISHSTDPAGSTASSSKPADNGSASASSSPDTTSGAQGHGKLKYWIASSGSDYVGYNITVKVNDTPVDSFYGPGKTVNITNLVKSGDNAVTFEAKSLGADYNKHTGDKSAQLKLLIVGGPVVQEDFRPADVRASFLKNATDSGDDTQTLHFTGE